MGSGAARGFAVATGRSTGAGARAGKARSRSLRAARTRTLLTHPHPYRGRLIAVEGIDGSGKSTQLLLLERWLGAQGYRVHFTEWNSSPLVRRSMKRGKKLPRNGIGCGR